jgi:lysophospholipase L1-like esterase
MRIARGQAAGFWLAILPLWLTPGEAATTAKKKTSRAPATRVSAAPAAPKKRAAQSAPNPTAKRRTRPVRRAPAVRVTAAQRAEAAEAVAATLQRTSETVPIENPRALVPFFEQLYRSQQTPGGEPLRILHYGDSHTAADDWTHQIRELLQAEFGRGGSGFSLAGRPFAGYRRWDLKTGASRNWKSEGLLAREGDGLWGLGGVSISTSRPNEFVTLEAECARLEILFLRQPGGGVLKLFDNGAEAGAVETAGELGPGYYSLAVEPGWHRFELRTVQAAPVRLFGWVTEEDRGVTYEALGINGAQASIVFRWDADLLASQLARRNPALIVLAYGTNEAGNPDWTLENYREMFAALLAKFRAAAPTASILVVGPPDRFSRVRGRWVPYARVDRIIAAQREAALASGCAYWDLREKMGGAGAMRSWVYAGLAQGDHVHFTAAGYRRIGAALFEDLMYNYRRYLKVREELLGHAVPPPQDPAGADDPPSEDH